MNFSLGIKSDPIEYRYSFTWLFRFMQRNHIKYLQMGSFFEMYSIDKAYFKDLKEEAESYGITIKSCFTAHRELGGFFTGNPYFEKAAFDNYKTLIDIASILGSDYAGSNPGAVFRDRTSDKDRGIRVYLEHMKTLMEYARAKGLKALTIEPMSCSMEPPTTPDEIRYMMDFLGEYHNKNKNTVPVYLCSDTSHGLADKDHKVIYNNETLFESSIPYTCEFHFKNTDSIFSSTFGFSKELNERGIVDLKHFQKIIEKNNLLWPVDHVVGYLEIGGPKLGRDYSDHILETQLQHSMDALKSVFSEQMAELV